MARSPQATRVITQMNDFTAKQSRKLIINVHGNLVKDTPRDTSWAANNWLPAIGSPARQVVGSPESPTLGASTSAGTLATVALTYEFRQGPVYISNNVPYIRKLNEGSSKQAPAGFVELGVQRAVRESI